ncbi:CehA/McbA family metallohydrolase [uncultured Clostridium sp.]|uniref:CehA/McbA family metallohydrolase n=1 Tax=uncultured Clostridium sp. TaxID=59620 RepID=UPI0025CBB9C8|nr:CehA/McbA family metallohydrolase [uncultured Clostridium sp.]
MENKSDFQNRFEFETKKDISVEKFDIDKYYKYLNIKFNSYEKKNPVVYLMLIDSNNVLRLQYRSINSKNNLIISEDSSKCSIGAYPGKIVTGVWKLIIISLEKKKENQKYNVVIEGLNEFINGDIDKLGEDVWVDYNTENKSLLSLSSYDWNKSFSKERRWYKGDFHTHTILSDGKMTNKLYIKAAKEMNLDFAVCTEHNIVPTGWKRENELLIIPGTEITLEDGHFNILGIRKFPLSLALKKIIENKKYKKYKSSNEIQENMVKELVSTYRDEKAVYSVNHMLLEFWKWKLLNVELDKFQTIEICNDPTYYLGAESNDKVLKMLDILWNDGYRIYGIGGSDAHILPTETYDNSNERSIIGDPATFIYSNGLIADNIIHSLKKGHAYVSRGIILDIRIEVISSGKSETYLPGDEIKITHNAQIYYSININLENINNEYGKINETHFPLKVCFIENGKRFEKSLSSEGRIDFTAQWKEHEYKYLSVEIREEDGRFRGYINSVYHSYKKHELRTFRDLFKKSM